MEPNGKGCGRTGTAKSSGTAVRDYPNPTKETPRSPERWGEGLPIFVGGGTLSSEEQWAKILESPERRGRGIRCLFDSERGPAELHIKLSVGTPQEMARVTEEVGGHEIIFVKELTLKEKHELKIGFPFDLCKCCVWGMLFPNGKIPRYTYLNKTPRREKRRNFPSDTDEEEGVDTREPKRRRRSPPADEEQ
ncbi:hypothetical protein PG997_012215 [Apiospora hydei]|uniref:Uncharacterized protein n=1 Tax=Apiospora hydei TaxID=1337664 RepID=A0ABR1V2S5_9PEZI